MSKYRRLMILLFIISICFFDLVKADDYSLNGKKIYIDPGHGGIDPGATYKDVEEDDVNLEISLKLKKELESYGATVYLTRDGDYDLSVKNARERKRSDLYQRSKLINNSNADMYLSVHLNASTSSSWSGAQTFYDDINSENIKIAKSIQSQFKIDLKTTKDYQEVSDGYLYKRVKVPGVLVELGYLSNPNERYLLTKNYYQNKVVKSLTKGIINYFVKQ